MPVGHHHCNSIAIFFNIGNTESSCHLETILSMVPSQPFIAPHDLQWDCANHHWYLLIHPISSAPKCHACRAKLYGDESRRDRPRPKRLLWNLHGRTTLRRPTSHHPITAHRALPHSALHQADKAPV